MMMKEVIREQPLRQIQTGGLDDQSRFPALMGLRNILKPAAVAVAWRSFDGGRVTLMMMKEVIREQPLRQIQTGGLDDQSRFPALMG
ncbi:unnamed protein product [Sphagnum balticum]